MKDDKEMADERIARAVINGTKNGKIKWKFNSPNSADGSFRNLSLHYHVGRFYVNDGCIEVSGLFTEISNLMSGLYREDEQFEAAIMELEK